VKRGVPVAQLSETVRAEVAGRLPSPTAVVGR
jgi:hypothetical protein